MMRWQDRFPHYGYLNEELNRPVRSVEAERRAKELAKYIHSGWKDEYVYRDKIVVYPLAVDPGLCQEALFLSASIGVRPLGDRVTTEEAGGVWKAAPIEDRQKAYEYISTALIAMWAQQLRMDRDKVLVLFVAGRATSSDFWDRELPRDIGSFRAGKTALTCIAGRHKESQ